MGELRRLRGRAPPRSVVSAAARASNPPRPFDPKQAAKIRSSGLKTQAIRSGSNDPDRRVPLRPGSFSKEPLHFLLFNPRYT